MATPRTKPVDEPDEAKVAAPVVEAPPEKADDAPPSFRTEAAAFAAGALDALDSTGTVTEALRVSYARIMQTLMPAPGDEPALLHLRRVVTALDDLDRAMAQVRAAAGDLAVEAV